MAILRSRRRQGRHEEQPREMPGTPPPPPRFWPLLGWLEAKAQGLAMDPQYDAAMTTLHCEFLDWQEEQARVAS